MSSLTVTLNIRRIAEQATEAYMVLHGIPCTRKFTDYELAPALAEVRAAMKVAKPFEWSDDGSHRTPDYSRADYQTSGVAGRTIKQGE